MILIPSRHRFAAWLVAATLPALAAPAQNIIGNANPNSIAGYYFATYTVFAANDQGSGMELWMIDVASGLPSLVVDLYPGPGGSDPSGFVFRATTNEYWFAADDWSSGTELWRTDGTAAGTLLVADVDPGLVGSNPRDLTVVGNLLVFTANDGSTGRELWVNDGTTTFQLADIMPGALGSDPRDFAVWNGKLYFSAENLLNGRELWVSDGTIAGTTMLQDIVPGATSGNPAGLCALAGSLVFAADTAATGTELWVTDGTTAGTVLLKDIRAGVGSSAPSQFVGLGLGYFVADDGVHGRELWRTDGTVAGTQLILDIRPGVAGSDIEYLTPGAGLLEVWCAADDGVHGRELWRASGPSASLVADILPGAASVSPEALQRIVGGKVTFRATTATTGDELWGSDGTPGGTTLLRDIRPGAAGSGPRSMAAVTNIVNLSNSGLLFAADDGTTGIELWRSNGTTQGTVQVANIAPDLAGTQQPTLDPHVDSSGSTVTMCIEDGVPFSFAGVAYSFAIAPVPLSIPGVTGQVLVSLPTAATVTGVLDGAGKLCFPLTIPAGLSTIDIVAQAFDVSAPDILLSDLATIGITSLSSSTINGGPVKTVGVFNDENHLYEVAMSLPSTMPASGSFQIYNVYADEWFVPDEGADYAASEGLQIKRAGAVPMGWKGVIELHFIDPKGKKHFIWRSYC